MLAQKGREILIKVSISGTYTAIGGLRTKSLQIGEDQIDVTDSDSAGQWRELLAGAGIFSMSLSGGGVFKTTASEKYLLARKLAKEHPTFQFIVPGLGTFQGVFMIGNIGYQGAERGEVQYSMSFESAGEITFTAA